MRTVQHLNSLGITYTLLVASEFRIRIEINHRHRLPTYVHLFNAPPCRHSMQAIHMHWLCILHASLVIAVKVSKKQNLCLFN